MKKEYLLGIIEDLFQYIREMHHSISAVSIANLNFDTPRENGIKVDTRNWILFYDECKDFITQCGEYLDLNMLDKSIQIKGNYIYDNDVTSIERELQKVKRRIEMFNDEKADNVVNKSKPSKIFISHSTNDADYTKAIVELLEDIGLDENQIFCSSLREYGIKIGEDIYERLKKEFDTYNLWVFFILSDNYYKSAASLNEMGAAWVLQKEYLSVLLPEFDFKNIQGAINPNKIGIKLNSSDIIPTLNDLKNEVCNKFECTISQNRWERVRNDFIMKIKMLER